MQLTPHALKATSIGVAVGCSAFALAMLVRLAGLGLPHATSADSGMMAGLTPLYWIIHGGIVLAGVAVVGALTTLASAVALRARSALAGAAAGGVLWGLVWFLVPWISSEPGEAATVAGWVGVPVMIGAFVAGMCTLARERAAGWRDSGPARLRSVWDGLADAAQRHLPDTVRGPDWRNARERWPLLLLLFVVLSLFAIALQLAVPDLVPWGERDSLLAKSIYFGAMPWSKLAIAWVIASEWQLDPFRPVALVGAGLGFNGALLAGLLASLRRTVPVR